MSNYGPSPHERKPSLEDCAICKSTIESASCTDCGLFFCYIHRLEERNGSAVYWSRCFECQILRNRRMLAMAAVLAEHIDTERMTELFQEDAT